MKTIVFLMTLMSLSFASANLPTVTWVGQLTKEQAAPIVELFNTKYSATAGYKVVYNSSDAAINELLAGKADPSFDVVHMKDADTLNMLAQKGMTQTLTSSQLKQWPAHLKDSKNMWVGLLKRARIIYYDSEKVSPLEIQTYESLGDAKFEGKLCLRQKKAQYTTGLHAFFLGVWGETKTIEVLKSWAKNSAAVPLIETDLDGVIKGIENGTCLVGVANTYYYMRHLRASPNTKVKAVLPNQNDVGVHVNVDGVAVLNTSSNKAQAQAFADWLMAEEAQLAMTEITDKYPVNPNVVSEGLATVFGDMVDGTQFDLNQITSLKARANEIAAEVGLK